MALARTRSWKRFAKTSISLAMIPILLFASPLHAATPIFYAVSDANNEPAAEVRNDHVSRSLTLKVFSDNQDTLVLTVAFASSITSSSFASSNSLLRIKIFNYLSNFKGSTGHIWLEAPKTNYQGAVKIPAIATTYANENSLPTDPRKNMSACGALTWMDNVPEQNLISFQLSRNCFDLAGFFWAVSQVETDIYNSASVKDVRYAPLEPFFVDMRGVPKPPKIIPKKDQSISASTPQKDYLVDSSPIQISASSSAGAPLTFNSRTPTTCNVTPNGFIEPKGAGNCQVAIDAAGSETLNPAATVFVSINLTKKSQNLYFDPPGVVYLNQQVVNLSISAESNLLVQVVSTSPSTCTFPFQGTSPSTVRFLAPGICSFKVTQPGDAIYNAREGFASFEISPNPQTAKPTPKASSPSSDSQSDPKPAPAPSPSRVAISGKVTSNSGGATGSTSITDSRNVAGNAKKEIICTKPGAPIKKVKAANPKCPPGYKKK